MESPLRCSLTWWSLSFLFFEQQNGLSADLGTEIAAAGTETPIGVPLDPYFCVQRSRNNVSELLRFVKRWSS